MVAIFRSSAFVHLHAYAIAHICISTYMLLRIPTSSLRLSVANSVATRNWTFQTCRHKEPGMHWTIHGNHLFQNSHHFIVKSMLKNSRQRARSLNRIFLSCLSPNR